jgi:serine/threonine-protein kinase
MATAYSWDEDNAETRELPGRLPANDAFDSLDEMATLARAPLGARAPAGSPEPLPLPPPRAAVVRGQLLTSPRLVPPAPVTPDSTPMPLAAPTHRPAQIPTPRPMARPVAKGRWPLVATLAGTMSLLITLAVGVLWLMPPRGVLRIELTAPQGGQVSRAEVFVDGQKRCDSAPCIVPDLAPGTRLVKIIAAGYSESTTSAETVEVGRERVALITLRGTAAASIGSLRAASRQSGVRLSIDGVERGELPLVVDDVPTGTRRLRFHGERYQALERTVTVAAGTQEDLGSVELPVTEGVLTVELVTANAQVVLRREDGGTRDKVLPGPWPMAVQLDGTAHWTVTASLEGYQPATYPVSFMDGVADKRILVDLLPSGPTLASASTPAGAARTANAKASGARKAEGASAATGTGILHVNSLPVSKVLVDGRALGQTPQTNLSLPAGKHTVTFVHEELGKKTVAVEVQAGRTATASVRFRR